MPLKGLSLTGHAGSRPRPKGLRAINSAPTTPGVTAAATLTPGAVPQNFRCITSTDPTQDGKLVWDGTPATTALGTLLRYELQRYSELPVVRSVSASATSFIPTVAENSHEPTWSVRAVYGMTMAGGGVMETPSVPSNICIPTSKYPHDTTPGAPNGGYADYLPATLTPPYSVTVATYWNEGQPLNHVEWQSASNAQYCRVDRDGLTVADGLFVMEYTDHNVQPGSTHTYTVYKTVAMRDPVVYSPGVDITVTALAAQPAVDPNMVPQNVTQYHYDGTVLFECDAPYGFDTQNGSQGLSLRVHKVGHPDDTKFSGGNPAVSGSPQQRRHRIALAVSGIPVGGGDYAFGFCDKAGPDSMMDTGMNEAIASGMANMAAVSNGHGPPCFVPTLIGPEVVYTLSGTPEAGAITTLRGDPTRGSSLTFKQDTGFVRRVYADYTPAFKVVSTDENSPIDFVLYENPDFYAVGIQMDTINSKAFFMKGHFMDMGIEGGSPDTNGPAHTSNGAFYFEPKKGFTLAPYETLRVFVVVDNQTSGRDWLDLFVKEQADPFLKPGKFFEFNRRPTVSGKVFRAEFLDIRSAYVFYPPTSTNAGLTSSDRGQSTGPNFIYNSVIGPNTTSPPANILGQADFHTDCPQEMELFFQYAPDGSMKYRTVHRTRWTDDLVLQGGGANVGGVVFIDETVIDPSIKWPWFDAPNTVLTAPFEHLVYHQHLEARGDVMDYMPRQRYKQNRRPYRKERHWLGAGFDVIPIPVGQTKAPFPF